MKREFRQIAEDVPGSEGPVVDQQGRLFVVSPRRGLIYEITEGGEKREHAQTDGVPAGLAVDAENHLWVADMKRGVLRVSPDGQVEPVATEFEGQPIRGCNDCALDREGNLYVTAPAGSTLESPVGELFCVLRDRRVVRLDGGYAFCNGLAVTPDDSRLIVAETRTKLLWVYDIVRPGEVTNRRTFARLSGDHRGGPDGIDFDRDGHLLATNHGAGRIEVFDLDGRPLEAIALPFDHPSNLHFEGPENRVLYVTEHTHHGVWRAAWR